MTYHCCVCQDLAFPCAAESFFRFVSLCPHCPATDDDDVEADEVGFVKFELVADDSESVRNVVADADAVAVRGDDPSYAE